MKCGGRGSLAGNGTGRAQPWGRKSTWVRHSKGSCWSAAKSNACRSPENAKKRWRAAQCVDTTSDPFVLVNRHGLHPSRAKTSPAAEKKQKKIFGHEVDPEGIRTGKRALKATATTPARRVRPYVALTLACQPALVEDRRILVVDDEPAVRAALERALMLERYDVTLAAGSADALSRLQARTFDLIVLDVMMPDMSGIELCKRLREAGDRTPVLMLTAREAVDDRVEGLDAGADDYMAKPFALRELMARVRALLRRGDSEGDAGQTLRYAELSLDMRGYSARRGERELELTRTEFRLLELFLRHPRQVLTRTSIFEHVWGYDFGPSSNALGVYVGYLRRKLEEGGESRLLHTIRGVGYVLREQPR
jgi:two-component system, OmpR family, response regulator MprA